MSRFLVVLVAVGVVASAGAADPPRFDPQTVDDAVIAARKSWRVPGVAVLIVRDGKVIHLKGYGTKRHGKDEPVTPDTLFPLASCTKAFTAAALAALVDQGKLGWDDPVAKHLPSFHLSDEAADKLVSIRDLMCHRTGVGPHDLLWYRAAWDAGESVRRVAKLPLTAPFRGGYQYSSLPVMAAGLAAANRYDADWDQLVREVVCDPLGMKAVAFTGKQAAKFPDRASGHRLTPAGAVEAMPEYPMPEPNPAGSMFCTARDLAPWVRLHLEGGKWDGKQVISAKNLGETRQPHTPIRMAPAVQAQNPDTRQMCYAMGWVVYDHRGELVVAHGGVIDGFRLQVTLLPDRKTGFVLLGNLHETKMNWALGNALLDHLLGLPPKDWNAHYQKVDEDERAAKKATKDQRDRDRQPERKPTLPTDRYAGEYDHPAYGPCRVTAEGGALEWRYGTFRVPLEHWQDDTFRATAGLFADELFEFTATPDRVGGVRFRGIQFQRK